MLGVGDTMMCTLVYIDNNRILVRDASDLVFVVHVPSHLINHFQVIGSTVKIRYYRRNLFGCPVAPRVQV